MSNDYGENCGKQSSDMSRNFLLELPKQHALYIGVAPAKVILTGISFLTHENVVWLVAHCLCKHACVFATLAAVPSERTSA